MAMMESQDTRKHSPGSWLRIAAVGRNPKKTLIRMVVLAGVCVVVFKYILLPVRVTGISMEPTYRDHSVNLINALSYVRHEPERGDVVGIRLTPGGEGSTTPRVMYLKRIVGLPGETISFSNGRVIVDGTALEEPYEKWRCDWNRPPVTLGTAEYFVVGDNRTMPARDHSFGKVQRSRIVGKAVL
jgi:signal peptidase I